MNSGSHNVLSSLPLVTQQCGNIPCHNPSDLEREQTEVYDVYFRFQYGRRHGSIICLDLGLEIVSLATKLHVKTDIKLISSFTRYPIETYLFKHSRH